MRGLSVEIKGQGQETDKQWNEAEKVLTNGGGEAMGPGCEEIRLNDGIVELITGSGGKAASKVGKKKQLVFLWTTIGTSSFVLAGA